MVVNVVVDVMMVVVMMVVVVICGAEANLLLSAAMITRFN